MRPLFLTIVILCCCSWGDAMIGPSRLPAQERPSNDSDGKISRVLPKSPAESLRTIEALDGFRLELLAAEPLVTDPVALVYDENGLAYVAEMNDYPHVHEEADEPFTEQTDQPPLGRIRVLKDTDGDGRFDQSYVFAEQLSWPAGLALWKGGVFVGATPDIWYLKDTDGDHRADIRRKVFTGFRKFNVQAIMNNLKWGLDHKIYGAASGNGGTVHSADVEAVKALRIFRRDFCFDPETEKLEVTSGGARFGNAFDDWGHRFLCNIRNPAQHVVLPNRYLQRNPYLAVPRAIHDCAPSSDQLPVYPISQPEPWREARAGIVLEQADREYPRDTFFHDYVTSSSGITIYRGSAYPEKYRGNVFLGEVAGNLLYRQVLTPDDVTFTAQRPDRKTEFVRSADNWFRPVNFVNAPDGTLHVLDMYREVIEHPWSVPEELWAVLDFRSGSDRGRIYRLVPPDFEPPAPPRLGAATTEQLVAHLESPNGWHRETAHRLLYERQDRAAVDPLKELLRQSESALGRLHALWSLEGLDALEPDDIALGLADSSPGVREHAIRLAESRLAESPRLLDAVLALAQDANPRVRFQVAFTLGETDDSRAIAALADIARRNVSSPWMRVAVLSSVAESADGLLATLLKDRDFIAREAAWPWLNELASVVAARNQSGQIHRVLQAVVEVNRGAQLAVITGLGNRLRRAGKSLSSLTDTTPAVAEMLQTIMAEAAATAGDPSAQLALRTQALALLGHDSLDNVEQTLVERLAAQEPQAVQLAALRTLASFPDPRLAKTLLRSWRSYTPPVREEVVQTILSRRNWIPILLTALENGEISPHQISLNHRRRLRLQRDETIRQRSERLFSGDAPGPRKEVIARYKAALSLTGDGQRGRQVFQRTCMTCHRYQGEGHDIGPGLALIRHRTPENVLIHILDPNREVAPDHLEYTVVTTDGRTTSGVVVAETAASITLRRPQNREETILRQNIEAMVSSGKSIMPEGLEKDLSLQDMADLLAYLLTNQSPASANPNPSDVRRNR